MAGPARAINGLAKGWSIKKEVSAGTILTAMLVGAGAITWGLQLESGQDANRASLAAHIGLEAHEAQRLRTTELIAEQRAIRSELFALREVNIEIKSELKEIRVYLLRTATESAGPR